MNQNSSLYVNKKAIILSIIHLIAINPVQKAVLVLCSMDNKLIIEF